MKLAPIVLFVYNRPWHTEQTLEALMCNELANESTLYIYCDGPKKNTSDNILQNIREVRQVIRKKNWCKQVYIIERKENWGLANSIIAGVTEIVDEYGGIIVLEDDLVTSRGFLQFMNDALIMYEEEENVFGISGHTFVESNKLPSTYFLPISTSWGWATWKNKWACFEENTSLLVEKIQYERNNFDFGTYPYFDMLEKQKEGKIDSWAIRFYASIYLKKGFFLFPNISLLENIGIGEYSTHVKEDNLFIPQLKNDSSRCKLEKRTPLFDQENIEFVKNIFEKKTKYSSKRSISFFVRIKYKIDSIFRKLRKQ